MLIFQACKIMESGLDAGMSWKMEHTVATFFICRPIHVFLALCIGVW